MTASFKQDLMKSRMYIIWRFNTAEVQTNALKSRHMMDTAWDMIIQLQGKQSNGCIKELAASKNATVSRYFLMYLYCIYACIHIFI
uniref:Uncharacterized protein n=1 Tax=Anguilla anguilla TaxID=7936 RepID=A0A0E9WJW9_ANGAN